MKSNHTIVRYLVLLYTYDVRILQNIAKIEFKGKKYVAVVLKAQQMVSTER